MRYAVFTFTGDGLPVAYRLQQEGHDVEVGMVGDVADIHVPGESVRAEDELSRSRRLALYDGLLDKKPAAHLIETIEASPNGEERFVLFDRNHLFRFAERLEPLGIPGNYPTAEDYRFEQDREAAKQFVREHYPLLAVASVRQFASIADARKFLSGTRELWVLKGRAESAATFVPDVVDVALAAKQVIQQLESNRDAYEPEGFILEPMVRDVIELTPERIFYDGVPLATVLDIENKPFGCGNVSIQIGCAQDLVFPIADNSPLCRLAFPPIVAEIAKRRRGLFYWDASLLISPRTQRVYFGEFCSNRPGYNSLFSELAQCASAHEHFASFAQKRNPFTLGTVGCSVTLLNPTTDPDHRCHPPENVPIEFGKDVAEGLWLWDAKRLRKRLVTVGDDANLAVITGNGTTLEEAVAAMYRRVDDFSFAGCYYRPKFDYLSTEYPTSIVNRLTYAASHGLIEVPFRTEAVSR